MSDTDDLQLELDALLCKQNVEQLLELAVYFDVEEAVEGRSRCQLVRIIRMLLRKLCLIQRKILM